MLFLPLYISISLIFFFSLINVTVVVVVIVVIIIVVAIAYAQSKYMRGLLNFGRNREHKIHVSNGMLIRGVNFPSKDYIYFSNGWKKTNTKKPDFD